MNKIHSYIFRISLTAFSLFICLQTYADGSKDLYPNGAKGWRAYLASNSNSVSKALPFGSRGTHYVYVKSGEYIAMASSEWSSNTALKIYDPDNADVSPTRGSDGRITNRNQELAGPKLSTSDNTSNRYTPVYYRATKTGIYRVEFWPSSSVNSAFNNTNNEGKIDNWDNWNSSGSSSLIAAWDVSVINSAQTGFITGRVYANVLNMRINESSKASEGFYGQMYVLTKDGYIYRVNNNGDNGIVFSFFVNSNGFVKGKQSNGSIDYTPLYKSLTTIDAAVTNKQIWDATGADNAQNTTHKMFYTLPANDLPNTDNVPIAGAVPGGSTWLRNTVKKPTVEEVKILGADQSNGQISTKGGYIQFKASSQGNYIITIKSSQTPANFVTRQLIGSAIAGLNNVYWNGKDGNGKSIPTGSAPATVTVQLQGAEVHFPYFDVENNINGIKLELLKSDNLNQVESDIVYWNDVNIPTTGISGSTSNPINNSQLPIALGGVNSTGISSSTNGHKWGGNATTGTFGDEKSMDTWTFIKGEEETVNTEVTMNVADLKITAVTPDKNKVAIGENLAYTIKVKNGETGDGNSDVKGAKFTFTLPEGFDDSSVTPVFNGNGCGTEANGQKISYDPSTRIYTSYLNLPNGCEITYVITAKVVSGAAGSKSAEATILRPNDVTDPDATNRSNPENPLATNPNFSTDVDKYYVAPFDAQYECDKRDETLFPPGTPCNNMKSVDVALMANYWYGTNSNEWKDKDNWTAKFVPGEGADIIFATTANNGPTGDGNGQGPAIKDLYLDNVDQSTSGGRIIGNLENNSNQNLVITTGNQLKINGVVKDTNTTGGTIVVKADPNNSTPNGTLIFSNPAKYADNAAVGATVEFYNKAYDCANCGYYRKSWQYFGIPVLKSNTFPTSDVTGTETINQWVEPFDGNKWQTAPYNPTVFTAFKGYEMTNSATSVPTEVYKFIGTLNVGNATVALTKTASVNYSGTNLIGNSYTAAIPINSDALKFSPTITNQTVYLFNTGTRDQWRKLNGSTASGLMAGQYLAVPIKLAGQEGIPSMIPSTHAFMVIADKATSLTIDYSKLVKNQTITDALGNQIATRSSATETTATSATTDRVQKLPSIVMDVIGQGTADRLWIFSKKNTTYGFDSGWDGHKMADEGLSQLYVSATDSSRLQVATVPSMDKVEIGFIPAAEGQYTLEFAMSDELNKDQVFLNDLLTGNYRQIKNREIYTFDAKTDQPYKRFSLSYKEGSTAFTTDEALINISVTEDEKIKITNGSKKSCTAQVSNEQGILLQQIEVKANGEEILKNITSGTYIVRLENATVNDVRRITVKVLSEY